MKRLLITGFDPFGGSAVNPSWLAVEQLPDQIGDYELCKLPIPTVFGKAASLVLEKATAFQPDLILCVGLAGGRNAVTPERIAVNIRDARIPDNEGNQPSGDRIVADGPAAYFATAPVGKMAQAIRDAGIPAAVSNSAGTFVCNHIMYHSLYLTNKEYPNIKAGFMHIPFLPEQVTNRPNTPSMALEDIVRGIEAAIAAIVDFDGKEDMKIVGGKTH